LVCTTAARCSQFHDRERFLVGGFGANIHDHEGSGTAGSTKSFAIMKCEGERIEQGIRLRLYRFPLRHCCIMRRVRQQQRIDSRFNVEYSAYTEDLVPPGVGAKSSM
jgi:hypothetical protein